MPCFKFFTNLPTSSIPKDFVNNIIPVLSKAVRKPPQKFICVVSGDCLLSFGGESSTPGAIVSLESIGHIGTPEENSVITKELSEFIEKETGISQNRLFITFYDLLAHNVGIGGSIVTNLQ